MISKPYWISKNEWVMTKMFLEGKKASHIDQGIYMKLHRGYGSKTIYKNNCWITENLTKNIWKL